MDALEFLKKCRRMCNSYEHCEGCTLEKIVCIGGSTTSDEEYKRIIAAVEQWSKEYQRKTRQSVFLEQYPEARIGDDGVLEICPFALSASYRENDGRCATRYRQCSDCRHEFWMQEVE